MHVAMANNKKPHIDLKKLENFLAAESKFITDLFSKVAFPSRYDEGHEEVEETAGKQFPKLKGDKKSRATSIVELQERLQQIQSKKALTYKEKLQKKGLKNRMKKKNKAEERNAQKKLLRAQKLNGKTEQTTTHSSETKPAKPVYNSEGNMVFSKFDFSGIGKTKKQKVEKDPKKILQNIQKQKEKLEQLEAVGETDKAIEMKQKSAWKNALAKAQGQKVKDDPELLKKSVKKQEQQKGHSKKKWEKRIENVKQAKDEKQKKRTENIEKRKKDKKVHKLKKAVKRGKVIPGF